MYLVYILWIFGKFGQNKFLIGRAIWSGNSGKSAENVENNFLIIKNVNFNFAFLFLSRGDTFYICILHLRGFIVLIFQTDRNGWNGICPHKNENI